MAYIIEYLRITSISNNHISLDIKIGLRSETSTLYTALLLDYRAITNFVFDNFVESLPLDALLGVSA